MELERLQEAGLVSKEKMRSYRKPDVYDGNLVEKEEHRVYAVPLSEILGENVPGRAYVAVRELWFSDPKRPRIVRHVLGVVHPGDLPVLAARTLSRKTQAVYAEERWQEHIEGRLEELEKGPFEKPLPFHAFTEEGRQKAEEALRYATGKKYIYWTPPNHPPTRKES
ncbi:hypothetical protein HY572_05505 [Candidatus Micrarchaeota archaeon]|nr:hypothetical protein [Candidatus Micrarchaeota archaeon]